MTVYERLILLSEWITWHLYNRRHMTLSALAYETAHLQGRKTCAASSIIDKTFWFDPNHCRNAYIYYRASRKQRKRQCLLTSSPHLKR